MPRVPKRRVAFTYLFILLFGRPTLFFGELFVYLMILTYFSFDGPFCERSMCHNYCLHGECYVTANGQPRCKCGPSFQGPRCEQNVCDGYCLNDGHCSVKNNEPFCTCKYSRGARCEDVHDVKEICDLFCSSDRPSLSTIDTSFCG